MRGTVEKKRICVYVKQETIDYINKVATEIDRSQGWVVDEAIKKMRDSESQARYDWADWMDLALAHNNNK